MLDFCHPKNKKFRQIADEHELSIEDLMVITKRKKESTINRWRFGHRVIPDKALALLKQYADTDKDKTKSAKIKEIDRFLELSKLCGRQFRTITHLRELLKIKDEIISTMEKSQRISDGSEERLFIMLGHQEKIINSLQGRIRRLKK